MYDEYCLALDHLHIVSYEIHTFPPAPASCHIARDGVMPITVRRLGLAAFHRFAIAFNRCRYSPRQSATVFFNRSQTCVTLANDPSSNRLERMCVTILRCQTPVVGPCVWSGSLSFAAARFTVDQIRDFSLFRASGVLFSSGC